MAKGSYLKKHLERNPSLESPQRTKVRVNETVKADFEAGKLLLIDKPVHWTSFDVVRKIRNSIGIKKVGHAGTLDPLATGLLIVCTGKFTKKINELMVKDKSYTGSFTLGATTPTYDLESSPENHKEISHLLKAQIIEVAEQFKGEQQQLPPIYSAIKKSGTPLYELARRGEEIELKARPIVIHEFDITSIELPQVCFRIRCSTGTYIRSIAHDFGKLLGCGGHLSSLRRTSIGDYHVKDALTMDSFFDSISSEPTLPD